MSNVVSINYFRDLEIDEIANKLLKLSEEDFILFLQKAYNHFESNGEIDKANQFIQMGAQARAAMIVDRCLKKAPQ